MANKNKMSISVAETEERNEEREQAQSRGSVSQTYRAIANITRFFLLEDACDPAVRCLST